MKELRIIGAGFSGLTLAYYVLKKDSKIKITILDANPHVGGVLQSEATQYGVVERAANAILDSEDLRALAVDIDLELIEAAPGIKRAYFFRQGKLKAWPLTLLESVNFFRKAIFAFSRKSRIVPTEQETLEHWGQKNLGRSATQYLVDPAINGIYAAPISQLSATLILKRFFEKNFKKKTKKKIQSVAPFEGMQALTIKLKNYLEKNGVTFHFAKSFSVDDHEEKMLPSVFCGSLAAAQDFLKGIVSCPSFFHLKMIPVSTSTLFFEKKIPQQSFGLLYPRCEKRLFLGTLLNSYVYPTRYTQHSETWIRSEIKSEEATLKEIYQERLDIFQESNTALMSLQTNWKQGLPYYNLELEAFLTKEWPKVKLDLEKRRIFLHGNYLGQLGLSQILIRSQNLAHELVETV